MCVCVCLPVCAGGGEKKMSLEASAVREAVKQNIWMKAAQQKTHTRTHTHTDTDTEASRWADMLFFNDLNTLCITGSTLRH